MKHLFKIIATSLCCSVALFSEEDISETLFQEEAITNEIALEDINENFSIEKILEESSQKTENKEDNTIIQLDSESLQSKERSSASLENKELVQNEINKIADQENLEVVSNDSGLDTLLKKPSVIEDLINLSSGFIILKIS